MQDDPSGAADADTTTESGSSRSPSPARSLREVERLIAGWRSEDPVTLFYDRGQVVVLAADQMVTSRTLEGTYPNYRQLIPDGFTRTIASSAVRSWRPWNGWLLAGSAQQRGAHQHRAHRRPGANQC